MARYCSFIHEDCSLFVAIMCCLLCVFGEINIVPKDTEAIVGSNVTLVCRSTIGSIEWHHLSVGGSSPSFVYNDGFIMQSYKERFSVQRSENGDFNLVITNVRSPDAGRYTCLEKSEEIVQRQAELIIFERYPSKDSCVASFTYAPICDSINKTILSCEMKSIGNIVPSMEWQESVFGLAIVSTISRSDNGITTSSVEFKSNQEFSLLFICQAKYPKNIKFSLTSRLNWSYSTSKSTYPQISPPPSMTGARSSSCDTLFAVIVGMSIAVIVGMSIVLGTMVVCLKIFIRHWQEIEKVDDVENCISGREFVLRTPCNKDNAINGLGILADEVYLTTSDSCIIEVFDLESGRFKRSFEVAGLINPNDMAISQSKTFIYISDWKKISEDSEIFCFDRDGKIQHRWTSEKEKGRISTTKESNVIVAESWYNTIREYTFAGELIRKFAVGKQTLHLWLAVKLENGNFVASFGDQDDDVQEICVINNDGAILSSTTTETFLPSGTPKFVPISMTIDRNGDIYVCDRCNGRIIILTPELMYNEELKVSEKNEALRSPLRICVLESDTRYQLMVADNERKNSKWTVGRILVWNLTRRL